jgi:hypothetical protein
MVGLPGCYFSVVPAESLLGTDNVLDGDENYANISVFLNLQQSVHMKDPPGLRLIKTRVLMPQIRDLLGKITSSNTDKGDGKTGQL